MSIAGFVHWQDSEMWLGYFQDFPDYLTQGESLVELEENLRDLYQDLTSGKLPGIETSKFLFDLFRTLTQPNKLVDPSRNKLACIIGMA